MFLTAQMLDQPLLVAPRKACFAILMAFVAGGAFALLHLIVVLVLSLRLVQRMAGRTASRSETRQLPVKPASADGRMPIQSLL